MTDFSTTLCRWAVAAALFLGGSGLLAAAYGQAPLYYSNQNQYFLHGIARAEGGPLAEDWLANTADPTPAFSALVALTARHLHPWAFQVYHALLLGAYAAAALGLFLALAGADGARRWPVFLVLFVAAHSALARWLSYRLVGFDYPWFFQAGVAGQYALGSMLQPSAFGVLLVAAVCLFVRDRPLLAAAALAAAVTMHSTYLLPAALLTLGFQTSLAFEKRYRTALATGALALLLVLPTVLSVLLRFGPTSPESFREAQHVLANLRIPHHARVEVWLDWVAGLQIAWVVLAVALSWKTRLMPVLAVPFCLSALLTVLQAATGNDTLALLFPWRVSVVLVPVATAVVLARLAALPRLDARPVSVGALAAVGALVVAGVVLAANRAGFRGDDAELAVMDWVRENRKSGEVYLLPVRLNPPPRRASGSLSSDFKTLADKKKDDKIIPIDLQRFRLRAGAPIYVDFKSIPYRDDEVIEWRDRLMKAQELGKAFAEGRGAGVLPELRRLGITHVVRPEGEPKAAGLPVLYDDGVYRVYRVAGGSGDQ